MQRQCVTELRATITSAPSIHEVKDEKPRNDKPNINGMDLQTNLKIFIRQINERLQFMKSIQGTHLDIHYSIFYLKVN
jgi:hypothetical protein